VQSCQDKGVAVAGEHRRHVELFGVPEHRVDRLAHRFGLEPLDVHILLTADAQPGRALHATVDLTCGWTQKYLGHIEASRRRLDT
jgi:hypothetical protein